MNIQKARLVLWFALGLSAFVYHFGLKQNLLRSSAGVALIFIFIAEVLDLIPDLILLVSKVGFKPLIRRPPGSLLMHFAQFVCPAKTMQRGIIPTLSDMQHEYFEALQNGLRAKLIWIRVKYFFIYLQVMGLFRLLERIVEIMRRIGK